MSREPVSRHSNHCDCHSDCAYPRKVKEARHDIDLSAHEADDDERYCASDGTQDGEEEADSTRFGSFIERRASWLDDQQHAG
jgi:hypothetical protein